MLDAKHTPCVTGHSDRCKPNPACHHWQLYGTALILHQQHLA
jgi:hypothetical protein